MKYIIRLNPKALNPITRKIIADKVWEVEQCESRGRDGGIDSHKVIWHCADVRVNATPIRELFQMVKEGEKPWSVEYFGICVRGADDAIEIKTGAHDASGN